MNQLHKGLLHCILSPHFEMNPHLFVFFHTAKTTGVKVGHVKNAIFGVLTIAMYTAPKSALTRMKTPIKAGLSAVYN